MNNQIWNFAIIRIFYVCKLMFDMELTIKNVYCELGDKNIIPLRNYVVIIKT